MLYILQGREVEYELEYASCYEDTFVGQAYFTDTHEELSVDQIDLLQDAVTDTIYDAWFEHQLGKADYYDQD